MNIRRLGPADAEAIERITRESPQAEAWDPAGYLGLPAWVAEGSGGVVGFLAVRVVAEEMEVLNLAVEPESRRQGVGGALLRAALVFGESAGATRISLEVRESNEAARRFYEGQGFRVVGRRRCYYRQPEEDALLMARPHAVR